MNDELCKSLKKAQKLIGTKIGKYTVDAVARVKGRVAFYFTNEEGVYCWDWL